MPRHEFEVTTLGQANMKKRLEEVAADIQLTKEGLDELYDVRRRLISEAREQGWPDAGIARALGVKRSVVAVMPR